MEGGGMSVVAHRRSGKSRKFFVRMNNKKLDSIETGRIANAHFLP